MTVRIQGTEYATVNERLRAAHGEYIRPVGIQAVTTEVIAVSGTVHIRAVVSFVDGRNFTGVAEVTAGTGRGPQSKAPMETAETSAVGRALAFAGYFGSGEGLASTEEIQAANERVSNPVVGLSAQARRVVSTDDNDTF